MDIFITGLGCISAIGSDVEQNFRSIGQGKTGIKKESNETYGKAIHLGKCEETDASLIERLGLHGSLYSRTSLLAISAAREAWGKNSTELDLKTGLISATSVGGMDRSEKYYQQVLSKAAPDYSLVLTHDSGNTTERLAKAIGISGYINTLSTACSSGANAMMLAGRMMEQGKLDRALVGGTDCLARFTVKGFQSLMIYDEEWCRPFDDSRNGLNLGEGSAFLVLETEKSLRQTGNNPLALLKGWTNAADAYHQTASSPDGKGATMAMQGALKKAGILASEIGYINAHGTGTKNNDLSESIAIKNVFTERIPPFSSTKAYTGHTLAAAGAIEAVYSVLALQHGLILPNLNYKNPMIETGLVPAQTMKPTEHLNWVLSNSFGFGGNNTSLIFKRA